MRLLIDQQLPPLLANWLIEHGEEARHVRDVGLRDASDATIWDWAKTADAAIISKDEDFAARRSREFGPQIVWLRIGNVTNPALIAWFEQAWPRAARLLRAGEAVVEIR